MSANIKPTHRAIKAYYETLGRIHAQGATHESATRRAFQDLLAAVARTRAWDLITELPTKHAGNHIIPDGTLRDSYYIARGHWEAKDTKDDLNAEIAKKIAKGYPLTNIIFEDTRNAVLYQDGQEVLRVELGTPAHLADLLNAFLGHTEPDIEKFEQAVDEFKLRVPELATGLQKIIEDAHKATPKFKTAFASFFEMCQSSLNPNISIAAVNEMLVQHLLTERLIRTIFDNEEFTQRNVIAAEVEKVIAALVSKSFNRTEFLKSLNRFYVAIEEAAKNLTEFSEKQHFLNTVYERFFQGYSVKVADTHGIVYTPQPIVDFMCASVAEVLEKEFGKTLGSKDVNILDPCTGTGNFIVNLLKRIPKQDLPRVYKNQLFANEIMLLPYYIAALNIEHAYYEITGEYESFEGLCFVDTLDMAEHAQAEFGFMTQANTARVQRQKATPITVIIGNPPYNVGQLNENDNNKNRKYPVIDKRISQTYAADSAASNKNALSDAYVKFFRWAVDRLEGRDGIVCFVTNNSFVDQLSFDGMRKHMAADFTQIYHVDLHGNVRKNPKLSGTTHNVFGIQVGVGITVAVRKSKDADRGIYYHRVPEFWRKEEKLHLLAVKSSVNGLPKASKSGKSVEGWSSLKPDTQYTWLTPENAQSFSAFHPLGTRATKSSLDPNSEAIFKAYTRGIATCRDSVVYDFSENSLQGRVKEFIDNYNAEVDRWKRSATNESHVDDFVRYEKIKWSRDLKLDLSRGNHAEYSTKKFRSALYRPFTKRILFFDRVLNEEVYGLPSVFPVASLSETNLVIVTSDVAFRANTFNALITDSIPDLHLCASVDAHQSFPYYVYNEDGSNRRENITDWALKTFREHYADKKITKWDIFYYVYGILHHPGYREKYGENLKRELPRVPYAPDFKAFAKAGKKLAQLHLDYENAEPYPLNFQVADKLPLSYRVDDKMRLNKEKTALTVNKSLTLSGIPADTFNYRLGNRSALEWVIDQYQLSKDARTSIISDPNRADDPEYIVRLVRQVITTSLETNKIVNSLPADFGG